MSGSISIVCHHLLIDLICTIKDVISEVNESLKKREKERERERLTHTHTIINIIILRKSSTRV